MCIRTGGHIVISHPLGRAFVDRLRAAEPDVVPHPLPDETALRQLIAGLPLRLVSYEDEPEYYCAVLQARKSQRQSPNERRTAPSSQSASLPLFPQIPPLYALPNGPVQLCAPVVRGFGRGSAQMGVPTANLDVDVLTQQLTHLPRGVYYAWALLEGDDAPRKAVLNVGQRPTFADGGGDTARFVSFFCLVFDSN